MRRAVPLLVPLLMLALLAPAVAQTAAPPVDAERLAAGPVSVAYWVADAEEGVDATVEAGANGTLALAFRVDEGARDDGTDANATLGNATVTGYVAYVNVSSPVLAFANGTLVARWDNATEWGTIAAAFDVPANATEQAAYSFAAEVHAVTENGTVLLASPTATGAVSVQGAEVPAPPEGVPVGWVVGGAAAVLVLAGGGAYAYKQRRERAIMNRAPRRSQALREETFERQAHRRPEEAAVVQQEIRQQEQVREKRRELQILEAKRQDALKTLDLLKKRHEAGGLTKLQYDNMVAKKRQDLARIEAEIAEMEAQDGGGSAAA